MHIRPALAQDLERVWELFKQVIDEDIYYPYDQHTTREEIEHSWVTLKNLVWVATDETSGEITGAYILKPNQPGWGSHIANAAYMVDNQHRGKGIGGLLADHSVEAARDAGYRGMQFNLVVSTNTAAVKAWLASGFEIIGTVPGGFYHVEQGYVDAYIFFRAL
jgi:L-amino acid N-acyltransferase YncA